MNETSGNDAVKDLHADLARKYRTHGATVETLWRSFDKSQRARCMKAGAAEGVVLKHSMDLSLGNVSKLIPEWNLRDITAIESNSLIDMLRHRATKSLVDQYVKGVDGQPGDHGLIQEMMRTRGLRHVDPFRDCYSIFWDDEKYGGHIKIVSNRDEVLAGLAPAIRAQLMVPQAMGELILQRQITLLQVLNLIIEDILEEGSRTRSQKERPKKPVKVAAAALEKLSISPPPTKLSFSEVANAARDQKASLEEYLSLLTTEPVVLAHAVNICFFSRPELVADEKGRVLPVHTDKYISGVFFEAVQSAVKAAAVWAYMDRLLELLGTPNIDKAYRTIVLQEIANICHLEYGRAQALFKRHVQTGTGSKWFKRVSNVTDNVGNARVNMKGNPEELTRADPQLHYMLRLCQPDTNAAKAADWMKQLAGLYEAHPAERAKLQEREADSLCDLAVIIGFIQDLSPVISMPSLSRKKGQMFVARSQELEMELSQIKPEIDLRDFAVPIDNLLEPGMAEAALKALDQFVVDKTGTKMGFLYQDLIDDCVVDLEKRYRNIKEGMEGKDKTEAPLPLSAPEPTGKRVEERRLKEKTRPTHSSHYEITAENEAPESDISSMPSAQTFKVGPATAEVFWALFDKSKARGSVSWAAFQAAMADLGFSVLPKFGSVYTFLPPESMAVKKSFMIHRPHKSDIEGYKIPIVARRLKQVYGWNEQTFTVA